MAQSVAEGQLPRPPQTLRIFLDANVLFSAARASGAMRQMLEALKSQGHVLVVEAYVCTEAQRNLAAKAGGQGLQDLEIILATVELTRRKAGHFCKPSPAGALAA